MKAENAYPDDTASCLCAELTSKNIVSRLSETESVYGCPEVIMPHVWSSANVHFSAVAQDVPSVISIGFTSDHFNDEIPSL